MHTYVHRLHTYIHYKVRTLGPVPTWAPLTVYWVCLRIRAPSAVVVSYMSVVGVLIFEASTNRYIYIYTYWIIYIYADTYIWSKYLDFWTWTTQTLHSEVRFLPLESQVCFLWFWWPGTEKVWEGLVVVDSKDAPQRLSTCQCQGGPAWWWLKGQGLCLGFTGLRWLGLGLMVFFLQDQDYWTENLIYWWWYKVWGMWYVIICHRSLWFVTCDIWDVT